MQPACVIAAVDVTTRGTRTKRPIVGEMPKLATTRSGSIASPIAILNPQRIAPTAIQPHPAAPVGIGSPTGITPKGMQPKAIALGTNYPASGAARYSCRPLRAYWL